MFEQTYGSTIVIVVGSIVLGRAICTLCGGRGRWSAAPVVGFAAFIVLADATIMLPGRAGTAIAICALAIAAAGGYLLAGARRSRSLGTVTRGALGDALIGGLGLLAASIPFIGQGRVGPGTGVDNDLAVHLIVAEALRSAKMASYYAVLGSGYPSGPHALVAVVGSADGAWLVQVFAALLVSVIVLSAIVAGDVLGGEVLWRRAVLGVLAAVSYLAAAYYGESAFKETVMASFVLAFALHLEQVRGRWAGAGTVTRFTMTLPAGVLVAGGIYTYSYLGVPWFVVGFAAWCAVELLRRPSLARELLTRRNVIEVVRWSVAFLVLLVLVLLPIESDIKTFYSSLGVSPVDVITNTNLGNLGHPLPVYEGLGIWISGDFRQLPTNTFDAGLLAGVALGILIFGIVWSIARRRLALAAITIGCAIVWLYSDLTQSPYVTAKSMVIASPLVVAVGLRALLTSRQGGRWVTVPLLVLAAAFCVGAGYSSFDSLRNEPVQSSETVAELAAFHEIIGNSTVLFLGIDDWAPAELADSPVSTMTPPTQSIGGAVPPPNKPYANQALDFDSVVSNDLDSFGYVITTNTDFASQAPPNFHLVERRKLYELWRREGPTPEVASIDPPGNPGAVLNCHVSVLRQISREQGVAILMTQPQIVPGINLAPGGSGIVKVPLPRGQWEVSVEYVTWTPMTFSGEGRRYWMPAYMGREGSFFNVGAFIGHGLARPLRLKVSASRPSFLSGNIAYDDVITVVATRLPDTRTVVPLRKACGKYVDWIRVS